MSAGAGKPRAKAWRARGKQPEEEKTSLELEELHALLGLTSSRVTQLTARNATNLNLNSNSNSNSNNKQNSPTSTLLSSTDSLSSQTNSSAEFEDLSTCVSIENDTSFSFFFFLLLGFVKFTCYKLNFTFAKTSLRFVLFVFAPLGGVLCV